MTENSSADGLRRGPRVRSITRGAHFSPSQKLLLLLLNALPLAHLAGLCLIAALLPAGIFIKTAGGICWLLLLPPLLSRLATLRRLPHGPIAVPSPAFFRWWTTWQLQAVFNRLPWIEEGLRFIPGVYSAWLRLWGARVGRLTLWSPGVRILDRPLLQAGDDVVFGIDARVIGHFGGLDASGRSIFTLGAVTVGDRCIIGGCALLGPGLVLDPDQATETLFLGTPFTRWRKGARVSSPSHRP